MSVERYHDFIESGLLTAEDRVELLDGVLVEKTSKKPPHVGTYAVTSRRIQERLPDGWYVRAQEPLTLLDSEPEPDLAVVRGSMEDYFRRHPGAADVGLVVEVADTTLRRDRLQKKRIYARAGIPVYWLVDLTSRTLEIYAQPEGDTYSSLVTLTENDSAVAELGGVKLAPISLAELFPPLN